MGYRVKTENGFSLIETIVSVAMLLLLITGLVLALELTETRGRGFDQYVQVKEELEISFETTLRTLRSQARSGTVTIINNGQGITFTGMDGMNWTFTKTGSDYYLVHNGISDILMKGSCADSQFQFSGSEVDLTLSAVAPAGWAGDIGDLATEGHVRIRNN